MTADEAESLRVARRLSDALQEEMLGLGVRWKLYRALYDDAPPQIDYWGPSVTVFGLLQSTLFEDLVLRLCRVTERADSPWPTASIFKLAPVVDRFDVAAATELAPVLVNLEAAVSPLRDERNRRLAHASTASPDSDAMQLRRGHVWRAMELLLKAVRIADGAISGRQISPYDVAILNEGDGRTVMELIRQNSGLKSR
jgi:hypothetical protein